MPASTSVAHVPPARKSSARPRRIVGSGDQPPLGSHRPVGPRGPPDSPSPRHAHDTRTAPEHLIGRGVSTLSRRVGQGGHPSRRADREPPRRFPEDQFAGCGQACTDRQRADAGIGKRGGAGDLRTQSEPGRGARNPAAPVPGLCGARAAAHLPARGRAGDEVHARRLPGRGCQHARGWRDRQPGTSWCSWSRRPATRRSSPVCPRC